MKFLSVGDVLLLAERHLGEPPQVRDWGLLASAVARPQTWVFGTDAYPSIEEKAAALLLSLVGNHAFVDGNKRIGLLACLATLAINGVSVPRVVDEDFTYDVVVGVAERRYTDVKEVAGLLHQIVATRR